MLKYLADVLAGWQPSRFEIYYAHLKLKSNVLHFYPTAVVK